MKKLIVLFAMCVSLVSCTNNFSNGERVGFLVKFSKVGFIWKSYEGELNLSQTGMNTSSTFPFSLDNDNEPAGVAATLDSAATYGWKVKVKYHQVKFLNWFGNRGHTDYFVTSVEVLDRTPMGAFSGNTTPAVSGHVIDTIYVVIVPKPEK